MKDFFKYLTFSEDDKDWGMYITVAGRSTSEAGAAYPSQKHPTGYNFDWNTGRVLNEYQLNFITEGRGQLETGKGKYDIEPGTLMIIEPSVKHRYRPDPKTGWTEYYIGFNGHLAEHFISKTFKDLNKKPIHYYGNQLEILDTYQKIYDLVLQQRPAYHQVASGLILKLLGYINEQLKSQHFEGMEIEILVNNAKNFMWENVHTEVDFKEFAKKHSVSYSYFRKMYKLYTGIAPHQFYIDLKIMRAKELIVTTDKSIKEITYELGFDSIHYFSRLYKKKTGFSPSEIRK
jgi:AraC-like DNA-binding protein